MIFVCDVLDFGTEADEGWEMVQRTNKTKFRPSPTNGPLSLTTVPARHAVGDGGTVSQTRDKERSCRANVACRQPRLATTDIYNKKQQQCFGSAVDVSANSSNFTKPSVNQSQQSKSYSHISSSRGDRGTKSSPRITPLLSTASRLYPGTVKPEICVKTTEICLADATRGTGSKLSEKCMTEQGDSRLNTGTNESYLDNCVCISGGESTAVTQTGSSSSKPATSTTDVTVAHSVTSRMSSSMTEVHCSESADIQQSSSDSDRHSFHLCRKSVSDDTLVERMTVSGDV